LAADYSMDDIDEADLDAELDMLDEFDDDMIDESENAEPSYLTSIGDIAGLPAAPAGEEQGLPPAKSEPEGVAIP